MVSAVEIDPTGIPFETTEAAPRRGRKRRQRDQQDVADSLGHGSLSGPSSQSIIAPVSTPQAPSLPVPVGSKLCCACRDEKPLTEFYRHKLKKDGYHPRCKECFTRQRLGLEEPANSFQCFICKSPAGVQQLYSIQGIQGLITICPQCFDNRRSQGQVLGRVCTSCKACHPLDVYATDKSSKDKLKHWCKDCCVQWRKRRAELKSNDPPPEVKQCNLCGIVKPASEFYKDAFGKDGLQCQCRSCQNTARLKKYREVLDSKALLCPICQLRKSMQLPFRLAGQDALVSPCLPCLKEYFDQQSVHAKYCPQCKQAQLLEQFDPDLRTRDGYREVCRGCNQEEEDSKECPLCLEWKPQSQFYRNRTAKDGLAPQCIACWKHKIYSNRKTITITTQVCTRCNINQPAAEFRRATTTKSGLSTRCRTCNREMERIRNYRKKGVEPPPELLLPHEPRPTVPEPPTPASPPDTPGLDGLLAAANAYRATLSEEDGDVEVGSMLPAMASPVQLAPPAPARQLLPPLEPPQPPASASLLPPRAHLLPLPPRVRQDVPPPVHNPLAPAAASRDNPQGDLGSPGGERRTRPRTRPPPERMAELQGTTSAAQQVPAAARRRRGQSRGAEIAPTQPPPKPEQPLYQQDLPRLPRVYGGPPQPAEADMWTAATQLLQQHGYPHAARTLVRQQQKGAVSFHEALEVAAAVVSDELANTVAGMAQGNLPRDQLLQVLGTELARGDAQPMAALQPAQLAFAPLAAAGNWQTQQAFNMQYVARPVHPHLPTMWR